jgi:hypothetical protein
MKKTSKDELPPKEKLKVSLATAKKVLKATKYPIGAMECEWLNQYLENRIRSECLPRSLLSNDLVAEVPRAFGVEKGDLFLQQLRADFVAYAPKTATRCPTETEQDAPVHLLFPALTHPLPSQIS